MDWKEFIAVARKYYCEVKKKTSGGTSLHLDRLKKFSDLVSVRQETDS